MELAVMTNQGWKHNYFNFDSKDGICSVLKLYGPKKFKKLMSSVVPPASDCPIPPVRFANMYGVTNLIELVWLWCKLGVGIGIL